MNIIKSNKSFTLVELLVVVALIAVLAIAVIISLNPAELLKQARDSRRLEDLQKLNKSLSWFESDTGGTGFMGSSSVVYVSVPDTSPTCSNLGLPPLPEGWSYHCVTAENLQKTDGSGWIPVNFNQISFGRTLPKLPIDPVNQTSTGQYYTYVAGGSWELTALFESNKHQEKAISDGDAFPGVYSLSTSPNPLTPGLRDKGLVGYWSFDEGSGTTAYDYSGNNNHGTLINGPTWTQGKVGGALSFDGVDDYVIAQPTTDQTVTVLMWVKSSSWNGRMPFSFDSPSYTYGPDLYPACSILNWNIGDGCSNPFSNSFYPDSNWHFIVIVNDRLINKTNLYIDGNYIGYANWRDTAQSAPRYFYIARFDTEGYFYFWSGLIDEVRIYNRALSDAEIQAIYNATK